MIKSLAIYIILYTGIIHLNAQQTPAPFVYEVYDDIYQVMHTRQSPEKPKLILSDNPKEIALFSPRMNEISIGQQFIDLARAFGADSMNVIAQVMSHELAHVLLEQSSIIKNIGSGYASREFNKRLLETHASLRDSLYERQADEYSFFYAQIAGYHTSDLAPRILDSIYKQWNLKDSDLIRYPVLKERKLIAQTASKKINVLKEIFDISMLSSLSGDYNLSIDLYKFILEEDFNSREIYNNLGTAYLMKAISNLDKTEYPYIFPVQMDLDTKLESERGFDINVENDIRKALQQFNFANEGREKYPIALLNKAICEWLLEDEEYEISMFRLSKLKNSNLDAQISILQCINEFHNNKDTSIYINALNDLKSETALAENNLSMLTGIYKNNKLKKNKYPKYELPYFEFEFNELAEVSDTLYEAFGSNASKLSIKKLEDENWEGVYMKSKKARPHCEIKIYKLKQVKNKKIKTNDFGNYEFGNYRYVIEDEYIYVINPFKEIEYIYYIN